MVKILITGITGFLGSHIAEHLIANHIPVIGVKRSTSSTWRCGAMENKIEWLDFDELDQLKTKANQNLSLTIIHCAWIGVEAADRDNWLMQAKNIELFIKLLDLANYINVKKFIFLGSQAEYGLINGKADEVDDVLPTTAYGSIKLSCLEILKTFAAQHQMNWIWLRVFSIFGEREDTNWLIPSIVKKMKEGQEMDFTSGEQKYAYLYVHDFSRILKALVVENVDSGIYNISSTYVQQLKSIIESIRMIINPNFKLNFGAIPYRKDQPMHIEGNMSKLINAIGPFEFTDFNVALSNTLNYYVSN